MSDHSPNNDAATNGASTARRDARTAARAWVTAAAIRLGVTQVTVRRWIRSGRLNPSCQDIYGNIFPYLDRELSAEARAEVERHIAACPGCEDHFAFDGAVLRFVRQRSPRALASADLQERLLAPFHGRPAPEP
jgi:anti-sigma factor (TIGR02949 family)